MPRCDELMSSFTLWAFLFLALYVGWLIALTVRSWRAGAGNLNDYFLAGKNVGFIASVLTFWATYFSAVALLGAAGFYYIHGIGNFYFAALGYCLLAITTGTVGVRLWKLSRRYPELRSPIQLYLRSYQSPALETFFVVITLLCMVPYMAAQITGFAWLIESSLGLHYIYTAAGALLVIYLYSESGGLKNIVQTDVLQSSMTIIGCIGVVVAFLWMNWRMDFGQFFRDVDALKSASLLEIPGPNGYYTPLVVISLAILISIGPVPMAQNAQRFMIMRDVHYLKTLLWLFPIIGLFVTLVAGTVGLGGAVMFPGLESGDQIFGKVAASVPAAIGALALVGVIAATMSTADSILLSVGFIVSEQCYRGQPDVSTERVLRLNRWCTLAVALFSFAASIRPGLVTEFAFNAFGGMLQLAPVMFAGVYELRVSKTWAFASVIGGLCLVVLGNTPLYSEMIFAGVPHYLAGFLVASTILVFGILSGLTGKAKTKA